MSILFDPEPGHEGEGITNGDPANWTDAEWLSVAEQIAQVAQPRRPLCWSWPCDCPPHAWLNGYCQWDMRNWHDASEEHSFVDWREREHWVRAELGQRVAEHVELGPDRKFFMEQGRLRQRLREMGEL